jgi:NAD+ kinase
MPAIRTVGLVAARSKPEAHHLAERIALFVREHGATAVSEDQLNRMDRSDVDAIIVLGGDGLMMRCANRYPDIPLFGINFGKVGYLAAVEQHDWQNALESLFQGDYRIEEGATLAATVQRGDKTFDQGWAINDVVIRGGLRMVEVEAYVDGRYVNTYPGDGMIVATTQGSTAYCMAAGGPIMMSGVRGFAMVPISAHSPIRTPIVLAEDTTTELLMTNDHEAQLVLDGRAKMRLGKGDIVTVRKGEHQFRLIALSSTSFFEAVRTKFNYLIRPDAVPTRAPSLTPRNGCTVSHE